MMSRAKALGVGLLVLAALWSAALWSATPASAAPASAGRPGGQTLVVSQVDGLDPDGVEVTVTGSGYDTAKGIYVAYCVAPAPGQVPTPCGGGAGGTSGGTGLSGWISSNPPSYGKDLAIPFGEGGSFSIQMTLSAMIGTVDCRSTPCAVVSRTDHTRSEDRSADVVVPIAFGAPGPASGGAPDPTAAADPEPSEGRTEAELIATRSGTSDDGSSAMPVIVGVGIAALIVAGIGIGIAVKRKSAAAGPSSGATSGPTR